jgi:hypothetical protein
MGEVESLKLARKRKERAMREARAAENRAAFGRSKQEQELAKARTSDAARKLDAHRREGGGDSDP